MCMGIQSIAGLMPGAAKKKQDATGALGATASAADVPLGSGLADVAKTSIQSRRARIRAAVDQAGG